MATVLKLTAGKCLKCMNTLQYYIEFQCSWTHQPVDGNLLGRILFSIMHNSNVIIDHINL